MRARPTVAFLLLAGLAAMAFPLPAAAQETTNAQCVPVDVQLRIRVAYGDIPCTLEKEPAGQWNVAQTWVLSHKNGTESSTTFTVPPGQQVHGRHSSCEQYSTPYEANKVTFKVAAGHPTGVCVLTLTTSGPTGQVFALDLTGTAPPGSLPGEQYLAIYAPAGATVESALEGRAPIKETQGDRVIWAFQGSAAQPAATWYAIHRGVDEVALATPRDGSFDWFAGGVGVFFGIVVWGFMVNRGWVQRRARKQVAATAAHVEAAKEPKPVLEGRKRALMAALKEIELAKQSGEIDPAAYDAVKAEFKKSTVTVMRALEESGEAK